MSSSALLSQPFVTHCWHPGVPVSPWVSSAAVVAQGGQISVLQRGSPLPPTVPLWLPAPSRLTAHPGGSLPLQTPLCPLASPSSWLPRWWQLGACGLHHHHHPSPPPPPPPPGVRGRALHGQKCLNKDFLVAARAVCLAPRPAVNEVWQEALAAPPSDFYKSTWC